MKKNIAGTTKRRSARKSIEIRELVKRLEGREGSVSLGRDESGVYLMFNIKCSSAAERRQVKRALRELGVVGV